MIFIAVAFSLVVVSRGYSQVAMHGLLLVVAPLVAEQRLWVWVFVVAAPQL